MMPTVICRAHANTNAETYINKSPTITATHDGPPIVFESHSQDARYKAQGDTSPACTAQWGTGGNNTSLVCQKSGGIPDAEPARWIIRRLTPTECARLQGFPDWWGEVKDIGADDPSVAFFREVYRLDCRIKGKKITGGIIGSPERIAQWHNRLHTDSAEYKMWGNGIALPNALYVMEGIAEAMRKRGN